MAVVLAAGKSTRMRSERSKVLHPILGREIIRYLLDSLAACGLAPENIVVVVGDNHREVEEPWAAATATPASRSRWGPPTPC